MVHWRTHLVASLTLLSYGIPPVLAGGTAKCFVRSNQAFSLRGEVVALTSDIIPICRRFATDLQYDT